MPSTASVMTFPNAPGLRPTASEAFMPTSPTPIADPSPHKPMLRWWRLPPTWANIGVTITFPFFCFVVAQRLPRLNMVEQLKSYWSLVPAPVFLFMCANQRREHSGQEHEYKRLNQAHKQFQKVKRDRKQHREHSSRPGRMLNRPGQCFEQILPGENIPVKPEAQRDGPERDRDRFQETDQEEHHDHRVLYEACILALRPENLLHEPPDTDGAKCPNQPKHHKNGRHGKSHIQVRI